MIHVNHFQLLAIETIFIGSIFNDSRSQFVWFRAKIPSSGSFLSDRPSERTDKQTNSSYQTSIQYPLSLSPSLVSQIPKKIPFSIKFSTYINFQRLPKMFPFIQLNTCTLDFCLFVPFLPAFFDLLTSLGQKGLIILLFQNGLN